MKRYITFDENNIVIRERFGKEIITGEIESEIGDIGQIMQADGTFVTPDPVPVTPIPTVEDRLTNIEDTQDLILLKLEGVIV